MKARSHILLWYGSELCGDNFTYSNPAVFKDSPSKFALPGQALGKVRRLIALLGEMFSLSNLFERGDPFER